MTIRQNGFRNSPLCSAAWLDIAGSTHTTRWLCCHQLYLTPLKWKKERSFPFPASSTHFPSSIVPKKVVVVVESIDFTWSYLSLSYTTTTATASPNFSLLLLLKQEFLQLKTKGSSGPIFRTKSQQPCLPTVYQYFSELFVQIWMTIRLYL